MATPKKFGRYEVKELLGKGAMGVVYLAEDPVITRQVAIKVVSAKVGSANPELQARFQREFKSAGALSHPNIVTIHDVGRQGARMFIAMEYVEGKSLEDLARLERRMPVETVASLVDQICSGLTYAHERAIVHRDIKPANIIVTPGGRAKITDFGVAKVLDLSTTGVTQAGATVGTPSYMAPEQAKGERLGGSADQFSVAVMAYRLLTGALPFTGDTMTTVMYKIVYVDPVVLSTLNRTVPAGVSAAVMKALSKDPTKRFETCSAFAAAVRAGLAGGTAEVLADPDVDLATIALPGPQAASGVDSVAGVTVGTAETPTIWCREPGVAPEPVMRPDVTPFAAGIPAAGRRGSRRWQMALAATGVVAALGVSAWLASPGGRAWWALRGGVGSPATTPAPIPAPEFQGQVRVESNPPGASIWLDGADLGLVAPAVVAVEGDLGREVQLQLRRDGTVAAAVNLALGSELPAQWAPEGVRTVERFVITSAPPGARVVLDGDPVPGVTPVEVELLAGDEHNLRVELGGYQPASRRFTLADLTETQREDGVLPFPLTPRPPPGQIVINAPYAVEVTVRGRSGGSRRSGSSRTHTVELQPSTYTVELAAPNTSTWRPSSRPCKCRQGGRRTSPASCLGRSPSRWAHSQATVSSALTAASPRMRRSRPASLSVSINSCSSGRAAPRSG